MAALGIKWIARGTMLWIKSPDWSDQTAGILHETLERAFYQKPDLIQIWEYIGMSPAQIDWDGSARVIWRTLTREAAIDGRLQSLIEAVWARRPALAAEFSAVLTAELPAESWYICTNPFESHMIGPGNSLAILDRALLRRSIVNLAKHDYPVLSINGPGGSGRSYSRRMLST